MEISLANNRPLSASPSTMGQNGKLTLDLIPINRVLKTRFLWVDHV